MLKNTNNSRRAHNADQSKFHDHHRKLSDKNIDCLNEISQT